MTAPELISADGVYVSIGGMPVLRDVSLQVSEGEAVALIGGNGSGKSTLVRTLLGILPHQEGTISLFGQEVPGFKDWSKIGYVPQHSALAVANGVIKMNIDTDTQYAFTRAVAGFMFSNYDGVLKVDGEVGNKKDYDPRSYLAKGEKGVAARLQEAADNLMSAGKTLFGKI